MVPSKGRREPLPRILVHGFIIALLFLSTTQSQWISFKDSRNPKSGLWYPNMPLSKSLQQRSSVGSSVRGFGSISSSSGKSNVQSQELSKTKSRPLGHRSVPHLHVGPAHGSVHGGTISRHESVNVHRSKSRANSRHPFSSQFSQRSGQPFSWSGKQNHQPPVVASKYMSINLNPRNKAPANSQGSYPSSRRLLEVSVSPTRRPVSQTAGALHDSWPNSNVHHHLSPVMKSQQQKPHGPGSRNYYDSSNWGGTEVKVIDQPIELKRPAPPPPPAPLKEVQTSYVDQPVERKLSVTGGREKLVSNTLSTLAKLSPKKPIYVYMRIEGIAAINAGAEAGDVIKKLAGGSKLPFYNSTRSLPKETMPQVFLAPEDLPAPQNYGKVPIPNLKPKEVTTVKPSFTKILLPGGTKMTSGLSYPLKATATEAPTTTTTTPSSAPTLAAIQSTAQTFAEAGLTDQPFTLEQRIKLWQMFQAQAGAMRPTPTQPQVQIPFMYQQPQPVQLPYQIVPQGQRVYPTQQIPYPTQVAQAQYTQFPQAKVPQQIVTQHVYPPQVQQQYQTPRHQVHQQPYQYPQTKPTHVVPTLPTTPETTPSHTDLLKDILPKGAILESIRPMDGELANEINRYSQRPVAEQASNSIQAAESQALPGSQDPFLRNILGSLIEKAVTQTASNMIPAVNHSQHVSRLGQAQSRENLQQPYPTQAVPQGQHPMFVQSHSQGPIQHHMHHGQQMMWIQGKMDNQRPKHPNVPQNRNALKSALSFLGIQTTARPNIAPTGPSRPFAFHQNPTTAAPAVFQHAASTRLPVHQYQPARPGMYPAMRRDDKVEPERQPGTVIVQTPDASNPGGQKSTFVIANGEGNLPDLQKIMKVLNDMNGGQQPQQQPPSPSPSGLPPQPHPTRGPVFHSTVTPMPSAPTRKPTTFAFVSSTTGRPTPPPAPHQPQVMIRHPSEGISTPTQGPVVVTTAGPNGLPLHQIMSSTFGPTGPTTPRPIYVSSTGAPIMSPNPSLPPVQIIKAMSHPDFIQLPQATASPIPVSASPSPTPQSKFSQHQVVFANAGPSVAPPQPSPSGQPQIVFAGGTPTTNAEIMKQIINAIPGALRPTPAPTTTKPSPSTPTPFSLPPGMGDFPPGTVPKIIEVDPSWSPEEMQKFIVEDIMKHQKETHGGISSGPIVINADPSMASILDNSPLLKAVSLASSSSSSSSSETKQSTVSVVSTVSSKPASSEASGSFEKVKAKNQIHYGSKEHHHSKEVMDEKPYKKNKSGESKEKVEDISGEEKVIEKVVTEEKIVWNPGPGDGEMIPSRIKTEERVIVKPHGTKFEKKVEEHVEIPEPEAKPKIDVKEGEDDQSLDKSEDKSASSDSTNFTGLLRSKLKFEKMKQKLYQNQQVMEPEQSNPFSKFLTPSTNPTDASTLMVSETTVGQTSNSPDPTQESSSTPFVETGRFKIKPGDVSGVKKQGSGEVHVQGVIYGITPTGQTILLTPTPGGFLIPSPSPTSFPPAGSSVSPSSFPFIHASPSPSAPPTSPTPSSTAGTTAPGNGKGDKLVFIPAEDIIQTKNGKNQTVLFTTVNNLPDLMSQLSGTKTEVKLIDDLKTFQATLAKVQATQTASTASPKGSATPTVPTPTQTAPNRRMDNIEERPFTWRPNSTSAMPTLESLRTRFPSGLGADVLHAVSAGFAANGKAGQNQPHVIYAMHNGVPVPIQPIILQGTKEPVLAYYGYNWNANNPSSGPSTIKSTDVSGTEHKFTSKFKGSPVQQDSDHSRKEMTTQEKIDPVSQEYEEMAKEKAKASMVKPIPKIDSEEAENSSKSSRRRRPGALKDKPSVEISDNKSIQSVTPNVLSKRIDDSDEEDKPVKVQKEIFAGAGSVEKSDDEPKAKLPILLAPSIISRKSVVSKTGSSYADNAKPTAASIPETTIAIKPSSTINSKQSEDDDLRETQAELKTLLKKLRAKLGDSDDLFELYDEYYEELEPIPSTKATTTTTTTKATKKPSKSSKKSKNKKDKKSKKKDKKSKKDKKNDKKKNKTSLKTITTTKEPVTITSSVVVSTSTSTMNHHRHPVSSIEAFTSPPAPSTTAYAQAFQASSEIPSSSAPQETQPPSPSSFPTVGTTSQSDDNKDIAAKVHLRRRPLWVRKKPVDGLQSASQPSPNQDGKLIRLVRKKKPVAGPRPVFVQETAPTEPSTTSTVIPVDILFENNNDLKKRTGIPDSGERSQQSNRSNGKRKLKLVRLKGQRAQWRLKMTNDDQDQQEDRPAAPYAERLIAPSMENPQLPQAEPLAIAPAQEQPQSQSLQDRQGRQDASSSIEATVCIRGKCELISKQ